MKAGIFLFNYKKSKDSDFLQLESLSYLKKRRSKNYFLTNRTGCSTGFAEPPKVTG